MGLYSQVIFPRLCDYALSQPPVNDKRRRLLMEARGEVLEIGFGTGLNLPFYPADVRKISMVDPNPGMHRLAQRRIQGSPIAVERHVGSSEHLPLEADRFDCVVSTFTLCSVANVSQVLAEVMRVLKPGGRFLFLEHGLSPEPAVERWQRRLNWLQGLVGDGCRLDRDINGLVGAQHFAQIRCEQFYLEKTPKTHGYMYQGSGMKP